MPPQIPLGAGSARGSAPARCRAFFVERGEPGGSLPRFGERTNKYRNVKGREGPVQNDGCLSFHSSVSQVLI